MKLASVEQMRRSDAYTIANFIPSMELIRRAAYSVFCEVDWQGKIGIVVGSGNNGADGFALSCILKENRIDAVVYMVSPRLHTECAAWAEHAQSLGVTILPYTKGCLSECDVLVDCMLGTGFGGSLREGYREAIGEINRAEAYVVSVDINSGMNGDTGAGEMIVRSDLTVTVEFVKMGQLAACAGDYMERLVCVQIGIEASEALEDVTELCSAPWLDMTIRCHVEL